MIRSVLTWLWWQWFAISGRQRRWREAIYETDKYADMMEIVYTDLELRLKRKQALKEARHDLHRRAEKLLYGSTKP